MSPLELSILIHYKGAARDFRDGDFSAPAVRIAIDYFIGEVEMLRLAKSELFHATYELTEKGEFFVDQLCNMPLPVAKWVIPGKDENE